MSILRLGKLAPKPFAFHLKTYAISQGLPQPPAVFGDLSVYDNGPNAIQWGILGNTDCGDCVCAGATHQSILWSAANGHRIGADETVVVSDYSAITGYNPKDPSTDVGTAVADAGAWWLKNHIGVTSQYRSALAGFVESNTDPDSLALAAYLFGSVGLGLQLPQSALDQFDDAMPWEVSGNSAPVGGHYVPLIGRNTRGYFLCVTWGRVQAIDPKFISAYADEAVILLSPDWVNSTSQKSPRGIDYVKLQADMNLLRANS